MAIGDASAQDRNRTPQLPLGGGFITPSDTVEFKNPVALEVRAAGDVVVVPYGDAPDGPMTLTIAETELPYRPIFMVKQVRATGTTVASTALVAGY